jgi:2-dehydro-3-deoxyglucarate aldolase/4-hydroxy-2-oxoheptanedioate aldolase
MKPNKVKRTLRQGGIAIGTMVFEFNTTGIARIAAEAGAEFVIFDMEHTGWSLETIRHLMASSQAADIVPMVRVPATQSHFIARALDVGAMGLIIPMVETEQQARLIVQFAKYPPMGRRGAAFGVAHDDYSDGDIVAKMRSANEEGLVIALIETAQGIENVEAIAAVDGIDVLWIGHFDLTNSMNIPGQFTHPDFVRAVARVLAAAQQHDKAVGFMCANVEEGKALMGQGFRCLAYWGDIWIYKRALREGIGGLREHLG